MADDTARTSNRKLNSASSPYNAISFVIENAVKGMVNTAIPVRVDSCTKPGTGGAAGYVSCTPLVTPMSSDNKSYAPVSLPQLPFFRLQCGKAALVLDPKPGDIGLAIFAQQDCSTVQQSASDPVQPGSFRSFDMADGFYVGGFLNGAPTGYIELTDDGGKINVKCSTSVNVTAPTVNITGNVVIKGNVSITGTMTATGDISGSGLTMATHRHTGVDTGGGTSGTAV